MNVFFGGFLGAVSNRQRNTAFGVPQRGMAYQPRVKPWDQRFRHSGVLKERWITQDRRPADALCGVPSAFGGGRRGTGMSMVCGAALGHG